MGTNVNPGNGDGRRTIIERGWRGWPRIGGSVYAPDMGMYHGSSDSPPEEEKSGCRDVWLLTRAAFGILLIPIGVIVGAIAVVILLVALFSRGPLLGLAGLAVLAAGVFLYARWERHHFRGS